MPQNMLSIFLAEFFWGEFVGKKVFSIQNARMISTFPSILVLVSNLSMEGVVLMKIKTFLEK